MADPWTAAWEEAEATAPPAITIYATLELRHPAFVDNGTPFAVRVVAGTTVDTNLTLEVDAVLDAGQTVTFKPVPFRAERPTFEEGKTPECKITVDNVARELAPYLEQAVLMRADMAATYREYRSDDLTAPCYGPTRFTIKSVQVVGASVTGVARIDDLANKKFPSKIYTISEFRGLRP